MRRFDSGLGLHYMNQTDHKPHFISQQTIIRSGDGKILILKNKNGWMLPGGRMEHRDKGCFEALQRETREETDLEVGGMNKIVDVDISTSGLTYAVVFDVQIKDLSQLKLSHEHQEYAFVSIAELQNYPFAYPALPSKLEKVLQ